jgi:hypothetical protein
MKPKQLANILTRILGLSVIAHGIPGFINGIIGWLQFAADIPFAGGLRGYSHYRLIMALNLIPFAVGICLIAYSRLLTDKLFKDEPE